MSEKDNKASKKSAIDYLKDELKERANENADFQASLQAKEKQLAAAREKAKNKNVLRKIKVVDSAISKKCIRKKQIAHHDFDQMMSGKEQSVSFSELIFGIKETIKVICRISDRITNAEYNWACLDLDELKAKYKKEIVKLL